MEDYPLDNVAAYVEMHVGQFVEGFYSKLSMQDKMHWDIISQEGWKLILDDENELLNYDFQER